MYGKKFALAFAAVWALTQGGVAVLAAPPTSAPINAADEKQSLYDQALQWGRQGKYTESLAAFANLHAQYPQEKFITYDYITVLHWSGQDQQAIALYEKLPPGERPPYLIKNVSASYYRVKDYAKARALLEPSLQAGDKDMMLWAAELYNLMGDTAHSQELYRLLSSDGQSPLPVYLSRGRAALQNNEYRQAAWELQRAHEYLLKTQDQKQLPGVDASLAIAYIYCDQNAQAAQLLEPYTHKMPLDNGMGGNYVLALSRSGQSQKALSEGRRLWPDLHKAPPFAIQSMINSSLHLRHTQETLNLCRLLHELDPANDPNHFQLAYQLLAAGHYNNGLSHYRQLMTKNSAHADRAAKEAATLLQLEKYHAGSCLFEAIIQQFPDKPDYRQQYALLLLRMNLPRAAQQQYKLLDNQAPAPNVSTGLIRSALLARDYGQARQAIEAMQTRYYQAAPEQTSSLRSLYDSRQRGLLSLDYTNRDDHNGNHSSGWELNGEQNLKDNWWLLFGMSRTFLHDRDADTHATLNISQVGLRYLSGRYSLEGSVSGGSHGGSQLTADYYLSDRQNITLSYSRTPLQNANALLWPGGAIMTRNYTLAYTDHFSKRESVQIGLNKGTYSDGNAYHGFSLGHTYRLYTTDKKALYRNLLWERTYFDQQKDQYDSPQVRETAELNWDLVLYKPYGDLSARLALQWSRDYPDPLAFTPYLQLQCSHDLSPNRSLTFGIQYGARTDNAAGKNAFHYGFRQFHLSYNTKW